MSRAWYVFMGNDNNPTATESYHKVSGSSCLCGERICVIYVYDNGKHPASPLSPNMIKYIHDGIATTLFQPSKPYDAKKYVYLK